MLIVIKWSCFLAMPPNNFPEKNKVLFGACSVLVRENAHFSEGDPKDDRTTPEERLQKPVDFMSFCIYFR